MFDNVKFNFPFMKYRRLWIAISIVFIIFSFGMLFTKGLNLSVDFTGGLVFQVKFAQNAEVADVRACLDKVNQGQATIQKYDNGNFLIRLQAPDESVRQQVTDQLKADFNGTEILQIDKVGPVVGGELRRQALIALALALLGILIYMAFRFRFRFGVAAVLALFHDTTIMLGIYSLTGREISVTFIAAVLTIVGYSLNDTIVVMDRIRENWKDVRSKGVIDVINASINETLTRTINTALTTLLPVIAMLLFGGEVIANFAFAFLIGIVFGTYSSIYVAGGIVAEWYTHSPKA